MSQTGGTGRDHETDSDRGAAPPEQAHPIFVIDQSFTVRKATTSALQLPWVEDGLIGSKCYHALCNYESPTSDCPIVRAFKTGLPEREEWSRSGHASADVRFVATAFPLTDEQGRVREVVYELQAVAGAPGDQDRARESEMFLRALMDSLPDNIYFKDNRLRFTRVNRAQCELFGVSSAEEVEGKDDSHFFTAEHTRRSRRQEEQILQTQQPVIDLHEEDLFNDGRRRWVSTTQAPIIDEHGEPVGLIGISRDITARKKAEEALRRSEERFRRIVQTATEGIFEVDRTDRLIFVNRPMAEMLGYSPFEMIGRPLTGFVDERSLAEMKRLLDRGTPGVRRSNDLQFRRRDGGTLRAMVSTNVPPAPADQPADVLGIATDVTDEKQREEDLLDSEARFRYLLEKLPNLAVQGYRPDGTIIYWNEANESVYGYSAEEALGKNLLDLIIPPEMRDEVRAVIDRAVRTGTMPEPAELSLMRKDGSRVPAWSSHVLLHRRDGSLELFCIDVDLRPLKKVEQALRDSEERLRLVVESAEDLLVMHDPEGHYLYYHGPSRYGIEEAELLGKTPLDFLDEPQARRIMDQIRQVAETGETMVAENRLTWRGETIWFSDLIYPIPDEHGRVARVGKICRNITEKKRAEAEQLRMNERLRESQKLESLGVLAGGIAHEFNNLLTGILGNVSLVLMDMPKESPFRESLTLIESAAQRAATITAHMLAYSGRGAMTMRKIGLTPLIQNIQHLLEMAVSKRHRIVFHLPETTGTVRVDPKQIQQLLTNLVVNASEAIGDRNGYVTIRTGTIPVDRDYLETTYLEEDLPEGDYAFIEVADTGCGMDEATKARLFDPFFSTKFTGRGLGMAAVLGIVRGHNGAVKVYSEPSSGTTVKVLLPLTEGDPEPATLPPTSEDMWQGSGTVLVIDDEAQVRRVAGQMLASIGFEVLTAAKGSDGIDLFEEHAAEIVLVLLDMTMREMNGLEVFRRIREQDPKVPILLSSGYQKDHAMHQFAGRSLNGFVQKPYRMSELVDAVREVLDPGA